MKTITGNVVSSKPISLSKAASTLSSFLSAENGASKPLCAYLRRASASFNELKQLHKDLKSSRSDRNPRHHRFEVSNDLEVAIDSPHRIENGETIKSSVSESKSGKKRRENRDRNEDERDGKTAMASGGNGNFDVVVGENGKRKSGELKTEIEDKPSRRVEIDVKSSDRDESIVAIEKTKRKHKKKSEDGHGKVGEDGRDAEFRQSYGKSQISANNGETEAAGDFVENNARGKDRKRHEDKKSLGDENDEMRIKKDNDDETDLVELSTKEKKREEDADDLKNYSGGAIKKEKMPVFGSQELKRKESKKRKNRDLEEGGDDGSEEQQGTKRRKGKL